MQESLQASQFILGKTKVMEVQLDQFEQPVPSSLLSRGERTREDTNCRCELLQRWEPAFGWYLSQELSSGTIYPMDGKPTTSTRKTVTIMQLPPPTFWSHLSTLYMLLSCCLKRWSTLQAGFFLPGSTTQPRDHRLSTLAIKDLSSRVSFSPILSGCREKLYSSTLLLHRAASRRCKPAFG